MADPSPRDLALQALNRFDKEGTIPRYHLEQAFRRHPAVSVKDRALAVHVTSGVLRWRLRLDWIVKQNAKFPFSKIQPQVLNVLRIALYQIFFMDRIPDSAAVNEAVNQAKSIGKAHIARFVNGILREIIRKKDTGHVPPREADPIEYYSIMYSFPQWLVRKWLTELGEGFARDLMEASNRVPDLVIRVNTLKTRRDALMEELAKEGISCFPTRYSPVGIGIRDLKRPITDLEAFQRGLFQVQGEAAQICSLLLGPQRGQRVLEVCTGIGGKASHLAEQVGGAGVVIGLDKKMGSLIRLTETCKRLGIHWVYAVAADATAGMERLFAARFRSILLDSPCSGLGVISKHPDIKWRREESHIRELAELQYRILSNSIRLLERGGALLYVTCTISREENEKVVEGLLKEHSKIRLKDLKQIAPEWAKDLVDDHGFFRTFPNLHGLDGFFAAMFINREA